MPKKGDKVKISGTGTFWDGKSGSVEDAYGDGTYKVAIPFGDGLETLQDFDGTYIECLNDKGAYPVKESRGLAESAPSASKRAAALADYLGLSPQDIQSAGDNMFLTQKGDYLVLTSDEAYKEASKSIADTLNESGLLAFTDEYREYFLQSLYSNDVVLDTAEEASGQPLNSYRDFSEWFIDTFGLGAKGLVWLKDRGLIDLSAIAETCINLDGIAHFIATYDGIEVELDSTPTLYAYRTN